MMHRAWSSIEGVPYWFSRSYIKFQGHTALKIVEFDPDWAFPDCNSSLNSPMAMKWYTKLEYIYNMTHSFNGGCMAYVAISSGYCSPLFLLSSKLIGTGRFCIICVREYNDSVSLSPSVRLSRILCPLCSAYSSGLIHFIFIHLIKQLQKVCRV